MHIFYSFILFVFSSSKVGLEWIVRKMKQENLRFVKNHDFWTVDSCQMAGGLQSSWWLVWFFKQSKIEGFSKQKFDLLLVETWYGDVSWMQVELTQTSKFLLFQNGKERKFLSKITNQNSKHEQQIWTRGSPTVTAHSVDSDWRSTRWKGLFSKG